MVTKQNKTQPSKQSVNTYINSIETITLRQDAKQLLTVFKEATGAQPRMWGDMIGFGTYHYTYASGREGDFFATGFAIRKSGPTIYIMPGYTNYEHILKELGPHKLGKSCLYLKNLKEVNTAVLKKLIQVGLKDLRQQYSVKM